MLHDPSHHTPPPQAVDVHLFQSDKNNLRALASEVAAIAQLPVHKEKAQLWQALNDLKPVRPMVWLNEVCWHEMNVDDFLSCPLMFHSTDFGNMEEVDVLKTSDEGDKVAQQQTKKGSGYENRDDSFSTASFNRRSLRARAREAG